MATIDGSDEPLFADELDDFSDEELPPLPPPVVPRSSSTPSGGAVREVDPGLRVGTGSQPFAGDNGSQDGTISSRRRGHGRQEQQGAGEGGDEESSDAATKKVRKPVLTFKMDSLFRNEGFPYLVKEFPKLKFKGKGEEVKDLKLLMQQYEEWANNLFPKLTFHDFCQRVEAMAKKNEFKTQLNSIRRRSAGLNDDDDDEIPPAGDEEDDDGMVNERLSPELRLSQQNEEPALDNTDKMDEEPAHGNTTSDDHGTTTMPTAPSQHTLNGSSSQGPAAAANEDIIPDPWDVINTIEEEDVDPYEDFPDL